MPVIPLPIINCGIMSIGEFCYCSTYWPITETVSVLPIKIVLSPKKSS